MAVHSYVTFYPNTNVDYVKVISSTSDTIDSALEERTVMRTNTVLLTKYSENQLDASYFSMADDETSTIFVLYKKTPTQQYYQYVCTVMNGDYKFTDYNIVSNQFYHYLAAAEQKNTADGGGIGYVIYENLTDDNKANYLHPIFDCWSICNVEESEDEEYMYTKFGSVWNLGLNIEGEDLTMNRNVSAWDTLGRFPKVSVGSRRYHSMTFTGLLGKMQEYSEYEFGTEGNAEDITPTTVYKYTEKAESYNSKATDNENTQYDERWGVWNPYATENDKLLAWNEFITDGNLKLLKDRKGNSWIIQIVDNTSSNINIIASGQQTTISFSWKEVVDVGDNSIVLFGDNTEE